MNVTISTGIRTQFAVYLVPSFHYTTHKSRYATVSNLFWIWNFIVNGRQNNNKSFTYEIKKMQIFNIFDMPRFFFRNIFEIFTIFKATSAVLMVHVLNSTHYLWPLSGRHLSTFHGACPSVSKAIRVWIYWRTFNSRLAVLIKTIWRTLANWNVIFSKDARNDEILRRIYSMKK